MIWLLEGQSSQRDIIIGAREALPAGVKIFASHGQARPEITGLADVSLFEPADSQERIEWVLQTALENNIKVILAGREGRLIESARAQFDAAGLTLVTGGLSIEALNCVDDKSLFTAQAEQAGLDCVPAITVTDALELATAYATLAAQGEVCIKPVVGIYGEGFWRFNPQADAFSCFAKGVREVNFDTYLQAYAATETKPAMLVMPYMAGSECSVDMVCEAGRTVAFVGRRKKGLYQTFEREGAAVELAVKAAQHFGCDGIVNIQTRDDADGKPHLLEINPRYSGGIGYTRATGINLPGIFAARRLGFKEPESDWLANVRVKAVTVAIPLPV
ncbi:ATP-grasp domain-containing protein [Pseudomonas sp. M30-35]|uniref:ATP-grasp domain-containing protein n=1 Tax=Pseudomonas sp. M30-35 TaxID=1981174 RepID=UPI000B3BF852|nr:ATP-grasp domain-containing protein [Pseudomonas sp. M30-35]ARU89009.1 carboxylate--amine ligase [Pseudomonas sp. M30-35]